MVESLHNIKMAAKRTGLSPHVIRVWEKRYGAVTPARTETNRRLYSEEQIEKLALLGDLTRSGQSIGPVAGLPIEVLREMARGAQTEAGSAGSIPAAGSAESLFQECVGAVRALNAPVLEGALKRAAVEFGEQGSLQKIISPLAQTIGDLWREGTITAAHEHFASAVIRVYLGQAVKSFAGAENAPVVVAATPSGQLHELGALLAGATAANLGWNVTYLGASLPAAEIAGAARQNRARAVALSLVYPEDDPRLESELKRLRELLPANTALVAGGRAMPAYRGVLTQLGAKLVQDLWELGSALDELRKPTNT